eukprot:TRINITY_DN12668_c0_g2_i1.p1 TRINITY_DN12668_c0_g2~~TRINITY_DN12668_c0_g2_i1.p1  ORF type:complete len:692 (-),score=190.17 TRINITY_DN12668_c0_g2_i1:34-1887(-)
MLKSRWEASPLFRNTVLVSSILTILGLAWSAHFFWTQTPSNEKQKAAEKEVMDTIEEEAPLAQSVEEAVSAVPATSACAENVAVEVERDATDLGPSLEDYEDLVRKLLQRGAQSLGPKVAKGMKVGTILQDKVSTLADKAKALVMTELTDIAGSVARALEMEELMLLLDADAAISSNFPPLSILLAGVLVPVNLTISIICHIAQVLLVLVPVLCVAIYSEWADWDHPCTSIRGLRQWARVVLLLAALITLARLIQVVKCQLAKNEIRNKCEGMKEKLAKVEASAASGLGGIEDLKQLFTFHAANLQNAVVCEGRTRVNIFSHIVGLGTLLWLLTIFWNLYLYFGYMFVPGVVAFHPSAADDPSYCAAWVTVCAAKLSIILALLFFFGNVMTVFFWVSETSLSMDSVAEKIVAYAKAFDNVSLGLPVATILVKAFLLRGATDVLCARFAVQVREKSTLANEMMETEKRLQAIKAQLDAKESEMNGLKQDMIASGGYLAAQADRMNTNPKDMQEKGAELMEEAKRQAAQLEKDTSEEIEKIMVRIREMMDRAKAAAEEAAKQAAEAADQASQQALEAAELAKAQAMEVAEQAAEQASQAALQVGEAAAQAKKQAESLVK